MPTGDPENDASGKKENNENMPKNMKLKKARWRDGSHFTNNFDRPTAALVEAKVYVGNIRGVLMSADEG